MKQRLLYGVLIVLVLSGLAWGQSDRRVESDNGFRPPLGSGTDNTLQINGGIVRENASRTDVAMYLTSIGVVSLDGSNPTSVDMEPFATLYGCTVSIQGSATTGGDPQYLTIDYDDTAGQLDIYAWDSADNASTDSDRLVTYVCGGE